MSSTMPFTLAEFGDNSASSKVAATAGRHDPAIPGPAADAFPSVVFAGGKRGGQGSNNRAPAPSYSAQELEEAVEEVRRNTAIEVEARTRASLEADINNRQAQAAEAIRDQLATCAGDMEAWIDGTAMTGRQLALTLAKAIVPRALERQPLADIESMLRQTLAGLVDQPGLDLRLSPDLLDQGKDLLARLADEVGFRGQVTALADPTIAPGDATLQWKGGEARRSLADLEAKAMALIAAWMPIDAAVTSVQDASNQDAALQETLSSDEETKPSNTPDAACKADDEPTDGTCMP